YIVNNGAQSVDASITDFSVKGGATNQLTLVTGAPGAKEQMQLKILEKTSKLGFPETPAAGIKAASPLVLGNIPPSSTTAPHGVGFTFSAKYLPNIPPHLVGWDLFTMSYQFTVNPKVP
ncbi:MAG: hypothetical protein RSC76_09360, partial [Oscillospiraceae bacterium]